MMSKKKLKAKYGGTLRFHWEWSVVLALSLFVLVGIEFWHDRRAGLIALAFTALYLLVMILIYIRNRAHIFRELVSFATRYGQVQRKILQEFEIPAALLEPDGKVMWMNDNMCFLVDEKPGYKKNINTLFPEVNRGSLPSTVWEQDVKLSYDNRRFRAHIQRISMEGLLEEAELVEKDGSTNYLYMLYMFDETQLQQLTAENRDMRSVVGLVYLDNYEEVMERTDEVYQSLMNVLVERKISKYFSNINGLVKKLEKDKYLVILDRKSLDTLEEDRFSLLEGVKTINIGNQIDMTVSIGIGLGAETYAQNYEFARGAIDMALGRGGDQVVVKDQEKIDFYGGKTQRSENTTRVKSRVKAQALRDLMLTKDNVVVMGHSRTDMDAFGAAIGVFRAALTVGKPAHIVLGDLNRNIRGWVETFRENKDYPEDMFLTHEQALEFVNENTAVVVVDTNRPSMTELPQLLNQAETVVVLDHHRRTTETIENAALSYIEPSVSSSCEMIAEILQYLEDNVKLRPLEADCIYSGIILDTNSFAAKAGVRTFEAAAYLRRCGADVVRVRKALRDDMASYQSRAEAVRNAESYMDVYAVSICNAEGLEDPSVIGAQAANELLNIVGVKASFVATQSGEKVYISARSIDEVNVQLVMERLGGGGHLSVAGAQLTGVSAQEAVDRVKQVLKEMTEEGAI